MHLVYFYRDFLRFYILAFGKDDGKTFIKILHWQKQTGI